MSESPVKLRFLLDEGVPDSVGRILQFAGHEVLYHRDILAAGSPDQAVCAAAKVNDCILVACDKDMRQIAKKAGITGGEYARLSLLMLRCFEPAAASRVAAALSLILHEWEVGASNEGRRIFIEIRDSLIRTNR